MCIQDEEIVVGELHKYPFPDSKGKNPTMKEMS